MWVYSLVDCNHSIFIFVMPIEAYDDNSSAQQRQIFQVLPMEIFHIWKGE